MNEKYKEVPMREFKNFDVNEKLGESIPVPACVIKTPMI